MLRSPSNRPSSPMDIPARKHISHAGTSKEARNENVKSTSRMQGEQQGPSKSESSKHDPRKVRPAVAALLAMTSIPPPKAQRNRRDKQQRRQQGLLYQKKPSRSTSHVTIDELVEEWKSEDDILAASAEHKSPTSASLMNSLMEPPHSPPHVLHNSYSPEHVVTVASSGKSNGKLVSENGDGAGREMSRESARTSSTTSGETNLSVISTPSCTSLEMSMSSNSLSSLLDGDPEGEEDDEGILSSDSLLIGDLSVPVSARHRSSPSIDRPIGIEKKELLSSPAMEFVDNHPLLDYSRISGSRVAADLETANKRDGNDFEGLRTSFDTMDTFASADVSPNTDASPTTEMINPVTNDIRNAPMASRAHTSDSPSSFITFTASFKSNLTASFNALASAARSFSNFTAPSLPPDDLLTQSLLAPNPSSVQHQPLHYPPARFPSEMRPKPINGVPEPALRRYLNPWTGTAMSSSSSSSSKALVTNIGRKESDRIRNVKEISRALPVDLPSRHDFVRQVQQMGNDDGNRCIRRNDQFDINGVSFTEYMNNDEMIPLEPYNPPLPKPNNITRRSQSQSQAQQQQQLPSPPFSSLQTPTNTTRPREPRENSDFLRIVVLEMNMRRMGKLDAGAIGKARIWLPPRRERGTCDSGLLLGQTDEGIDENDGPGIADGDARMTTTIPRRWIGQVPPAATAATATTNT